MSIQELVNVLIPHYEEKISGLLGRQPGQGIVIEVKGLDRLEKGDARVLQTLTEDRGRHCLERLWAAIYEVTWKYSDGRKKLSDRLAKIQIKPFSRRPGSSCRVKDCGQLIHKFNPHLPQDRGGSIVGRTHEDTLIERYLKGDKQVNITARFEEGPDAPPSGSTIRDAIVRAFHINALLHSVKTDVVPYWEERIRCTLGRSTDDRVPIEVQYRTFENATYLTDAAYTLQFNRSAYILQRIHGAIAKCVNDYSDGRRKLQSDLAKIVVSLCPPEGNKRSVRFKHYAVVTAASKPSRRVRKEVKSKIGMSSVAAELPSEKALILTGHRVLNIRAEYELGESACHTVDEIAEAFQEAFNLSKAYQFDVTYVKQAVTGTEIRGYFNKYSKFCEIFKRMESYQQSNQIDFFKQYLQHAIHREHSAGSGGPSTSGKPQPAVLNDYPRISHPAVRPPTEPDRYADLPPSSPHTFMDSSLDFSPIPHHQPSRREQRRRDRRTKSSGGARTRKTGNSGRRPAGP